MLGKGVGGPTKAGREVRPLHQHKASQHRDIMLCKITPTVSKSTENASGAAPSHPRACLHCHRLSSLKSHLALYTHHQYLLGQHRGHFKVSSCRNTEYFLGFLLSPALMLRAVTGVGKGMRRGGSG